MAEIPEEILRRSAEAKAKASGRPVEEILAEMKGEAAAAVDPAATPPPTAADAPPAASAAPAAAAAPADDSLKSKAQVAAAALPEHLLRRSAEAKAAALGMSVEDVIAEMTGRTEAPTAAAPSEATDSVVAPTPAPVSAGTGEIDWKASGEKAGMPEKLLRRSVEAKVKASDSTEEQILTEMIGDIPRLGDEEPAAPVAGAVAAPPAAAAPPTATPAPTGEVDWDAAAAAAGMPAKLFRRSAEAKAGATGRPISEIVADMTGVEAASTPEAVPLATPTAVDPQPATAPAATGDVDWDAAAAAAGMPAKLFQRSAEAKAKATGRPVGEIVAELTGVEPTAASAPVEAAAPAAAAPAAAAPAASPAAAPAAGGPVDWAAAAGAAGIPESLFRRSVEARAKASGRPVGEVAAEMSGVEMAAPAAATPAAAAPAAAAPAAAVATAPAPSSLPPVPDGVNTQRLLTVVQANAIQGAKREPVDKVNVWPHLLAIEFVALLVVLALLIIFSVFQDAPLLELANPNAQPNPSKAPWYFLGLQELLSYFDPEVAGVLIPGLGLAGLAIIPYIDRNPSTRPSDRKFAIMVFTFFVVAAAILTIIGSFYRGRGFNFTFPWRDGIFFDL